MDLKTPISPSDDPFRAALLRFQQSLTDKERKDFEGCTLQHVKDAIRFIENRLASERRQRNMRRISKFLEGMNQLGQVIEVFLNVDATVAFVWGPIKFALLAAGTWVETLDCLLDTYSEIGEVLPGLTQYQELLRDHPHIRVHLENYYCDILEFHRKALDVFARPSWKVAFHSSWKTFKSRFGGTLAKLKRHRDLLSDEKLTAAIFEVRDLRQSVEDRLDELSRKFQDLHLSIGEDEVLRQQDLLDKKRQFVLSKLDPPRYQDDFEAAFRERRNGSSGDWILSNDTFRHWADTNSVENRSLYLSGIPGAGKTILSSRVTHHLQHLSRADGGDDATFPVVYFFFRHAQPDKRTITSLLLSVLSQLTSHDEVVLDLVYQRLLPLDQQKLRAVSLLRELTVMALRTHPLCFIVVDGLDECTAQKSAEHEEAQDEVVAFLKSLTHAEDLGDLPPHTTVVRAFIAGQRNGFLDKRLADYPTIQLEATDAHAQDIMDYSQGKASEIQMKFKIPDSARTGLVQKVNSIAHGMFLYVKIVLENLLRQPSRGHFKRELKEENFPRGLDQAYERVIVHILENPDTAQRDASCRVLGLVLCAERPLLWKEIQSHFCIDLENQIADPDFQLVEPCKHYCSSLVEVIPNRNSIGGSDDAVQLVHETARGYLFHTGRFIEASLHASMALFCAQYLNSDPFKLQDGESNRKEHCRTGFYSFVDYAAAYWWKHASTLVTPGTECQVAPEHEAWPAVASLATQLNSAQSPDTPIITATDTVLTKFRLLPNDGREWESEFPIEAHIRPVRICVETTVANDDFGGAVFDAGDPGDARRLYGHLTYKCTKPWCLFFQQGFNSPAKRDKHIREHERPFRCASEGCYGCTIGFVNEQDLEKHNYRVHPADGDSLEFPTFPSVQDQNINIFQAVKNNELGTVQELVEAGVDVRIPNDSGDHALYLAAQAGHHRICEYLLNAGAKADARCSKGGKTALHAAVAKDDFEVAQLLISRGADIFARNKTGKSLVPSSTGRYGHVYKAFPKHFFAHARCEHDYCRVLSESEGILELPMMPNGHSQELEDYQMQLMMLERQNKRRLNKAQFQRMIAKNEFTFPSKYLVRDESCLDLTYIALTSFIDGIVKRRNAFVEALLQSGRMDMDVTDLKGRLPIYYACESVNQPIFEQILPLTTDPTIKDKDGNRALDPLFRGMLGAIDTQPREISFLMALQLLRRMSLADSNFTGELHQLIKQVSDKRCSPGTLLEYALSSRATDRALLKILLHELGGQLHKGDQFRVLDSALNAGVDYAVEMVRKHCDSGVVLDNFTHGNTKTNPFALNMLLENQKGRLRVEDQLKALELAAKFGNDQAAEILFEHYGPGLTLVCTCRSPQIDVPRLRDLLKGSEAHIHPGYISTALHSAVKLGDVQAVRTLLERPRVNLHHEDGDGNTVAMVAIDLEDSQILQLLHHYGTSQPSIFSRPNSRGLMPLHCAAYAMNATAVKIAVAADQSKVNSRADSFPEKWLKGIAFGQHLLDSSLKTNSFYKNILLRTPLFIVMNRAVHEADTTNTLASQSTTSLSANTPRFRAVFDAITSSSALDLSPGGKLFTPDSHYLEAYLVYRCCDRDMVARLANAGFTMQWAWELFKWVPGHDGTSPQVMLSRKAYQDLDYDSFASRLTRLDLILVVAHSPQCHFVDIMYHNLPFAIALLHSSLLERGRINFSDLSGRLLDMLNCSSISAATVQQMMMLGFDGYEVLSQASAKRLQNVIDLLMSTGLLDIHEAKKRMALPPASDLE